MQRWAKWKVLVLALAAALVCTSAAYCDTIAWSVSGAGVFGSGTMTANLVTGDEYSVTDMTGNLAISYNGTTTGGAITFIPYTGTVGSYGTDSTGLYNYDDLVFLSTVPQLDEWGLLFNVAGFAAPLNLCGGPGCSTGNLPYIQWDANVTGPGPLGTGYPGNFNAYPVNFSATLVPEASSLGLLSLGMLALMLGMGWAGKSRQTPVGAGV